MAARENGIRVRTSAEENAALARIGVRMAKRRSGIRNPDGSLNISKIVRTLITEEDRRHG